MVEPNLRREHQARHRPVDGAPVRYREALPAEQLRKVVECYWQIDGWLAKGSAHSHRVMPDGCIDIVFDLSAWRARSAYPASLVGSMTRAATFDFAGRVDLLGVRFRPGGALALCGESLLALTDALEPASTWLGGEAESCLQILSDQPTLALRAARLDEFLDHTLQVRWLDRAVQQGLGLIEDGAGEDRRAVPVAGIARACGLSERQFERRFAAATGLMPATYRRIRRFRRLLQALSSGSARSWAELAVEAGYFDQAHMSREFSRLAGLSPGRWSAAQAFVGFIQDPAVDARIRLPP